MDNKEGQSGLRKNVLEKERISSVEQLKKIIRLTPQEEIDIEAAILTLRKKKNINEDRGD